MSKFHFEIENLKEIILSNKYFNKFISKFMNELYIKKPVMFTTEGFSETRTFMH